MFWHAFIFCVTKIILESTFSMCFFRRIICGGLGWNNIINFIEEAASITVLNKNICKYVTQNEIAKQNILYITVLCSLRIKEVNNNLKSSKSFRFQYRTNSLIVKCQGNINNALLRQISSLKCRGWSVWGIIHKVFYAMMQNDSKPLSVFNKCLSFFIIGL